MHEDVFNLLQGAAFFETIHTSSYNNYFHIDLNFQLILGPLRCSPLTTLSVSPLHLYICIVLFSQPWVSSGSAHASIY